MLIHRLYALLVFTFDLDGHRIIGTTWWYFKQHEMEALREARYKVGLDASE